MVHGCGGIFRDGSNLLRDFPRRGEGCPPLPVAKTITLAVLFVSAKHLASFTPMGHSYGLHHLAPIPAATSACFTEHRRLVDALTNDQLHSIFVHRPGGPFFCVGVLDFATITPR